MRYLYSLLRGLSSPFLKPLPLVCLTCCMLFLIPVARALDPPPYDPAKVPRNPYCQPMLNALKMDIQAQKKLLKEVQEPYKTTYTRELFRLYEELLEVRGKCRKQKSYQDEDAPDER